MPKPEIDITKFREDIWVPDEIFSIARSSRVSVCHDVFVVTEQNGEKGVFSIKRLGAPAKNYIWIPGGGQKIWYERPDSLKKLIKAKTNLELTNLDELAPLFDIFWLDNPFDPDKGIHESGIPYYAEARGKIKLDEKNYEGPFIITPKKYDHIRPHLHSYIRAGIDKAMEIGFGIHRQGDKEFFKEKYYPEADSVDNDLVEKILKGK
ncbi:hypothetical protein ACFLZJ_00770 [Nanoarchaeota archaeon]